MFKNYLQTALRNLLKSKFYSFINILGLAVGIAGCLLIAQYVIFEKSYDNFHHQAHQIYRVQLNMYQQGELVLASAENYPGAGPALKAELPEVVEYTRLYNIGYKNNVVVTYEDAPHGPVQFKHRQLMYVDSAFFSVFSFPLLSGNPQTVLVEPFTIAISESYAKRYFGEEDPMGKMLRLQDDDFNDELCKVTGVFKDIPYNSHLKFDVLISYNTLYNRGDFAKQRYDLTWGRKDFYTYILVKEGTDPAQLTAKFPAIIDKYSPGLEAQNRKDAFILQPLLNIHLHSDLAEEAEPNGNARVVYFLLIITCFILVIAWINYVNLSTARSMERGREVGVRKALGAFRHQLIKQFLFESLLVNLGAILIASLLVSLFLLPFNTLTGLQFSWVSFWSQAWVWGLLATLFLAGTLLSGLYPAFILASFRPASVLKGKVRAARHGILLRKALVVFQFVAAIVLVAGTAIVYQQLRHMFQQDLGFNIEQTLVLERPSIRPRDFNAQKNSIDNFKTELLRNPAIQKVAGAAFVPGHTRKFKFNFRKYGAPAEEAQAIRVNAVDYDFFDTFEMKILAGRGFSEDYTTDADTAIVITASAARLLGFDNIEESVGSTFTIDFGGQEGSMNVIGIVNDFHQVSLKEAVEPMVIFLDPFGAEYYAMKVSTYNLPATIEYVQTTWNKVFPGNPFSYFFLDDYFNRQYQTDQRFGKLFGVFAALALFVGGLGLLGLSAFTTQQRTKEIGIRKVLGASVSNIMLLLSRDFVQLLLIANLIAWPLVYFSMEQWLTQFAYRIDVGWWLLATSGLIVMVIALSTVSIQTIKAAVVNPVDSLKDE